MVTTETPTVHCDGAGPHEDMGTRLYPLGGNANLILCYSCWVRENRYRYNRGVETRRPEDWPQQNWFAATEV